jgi:hypothetical protein
MDRYCSTGQSPQRAVAPTEEEEEEEEFGFGYVVTGRQDVHLPFEPYKNVTHHLCEIRCLFNYEEVVNT